MLVLTKAPSPVVCAPQLPPNQLAAPTQHNSTRLQGCRHNDLGNNFRGNRWGPGAAAANKKEVEAATSASSRSTGSASTSPSSSDDERE